MSPTPNYGYNADPQFSVNHMAEYLASASATQRGKVIQAAKFPKKLEVAAYGQVRHQLRNALTRPDFGHAQLELLADQMAAKARREVRYARDEALRCERAVRAFQETFTPKSFTQCQFDTAPRRLSKVVEGVRINVTLDAVVLAKKGDVTNSGGIAIHYAFSADRIGVKDRLSATAGMILWALEGGQMEPLPRLCMAADIAEKTIVKASASHTRFRSRIQDACSEAAARWPAIDPPPGYDGPPVG